MIAGNGSPWRADRKRYFSWYLNELRVGDSIVSNDGEWEIIYFFLDSKYPQYCILHNNIRVFPEDRDIVHKRGQVLSFLLAQDPNVSKEYFNHTDLKLVENGCLRFMTNSADSRLSY